MATSTLQLLKALVVVTASASATATGTATATATATNDSIPAQRLSRSVLADNAETDATRARRIGALMGAFVADAAAMPLHWIYDTDLIATILEVGATVFG